MLCYANPHTHTLILSVRDSRRFQNVHVLFGTSSLASPNATSIAFILTSYYIICIRLRIFIIRFQFMLLLAPKYGSVCFAREKLDFE